MGHVHAALAAYAETTGNRELAGRDLAKWVGQIGLIESRAGSKAFSQLYAALALRHFGRDLKTNPLWQGLSPEEQKAWRSLLNPERFTIRRRIASLSICPITISASRRALRASVTSSASQTIARFSISCSIALRCSLQRQSIRRRCAADGRYDRYSNEYALHLGSGGDRRA